MATLKSIELAAEIVTAFVANNSVPRGELPAVIQAVHAAVKRLADREEIAPPAIDAPTPAVSVRKSVSPDYLICLDDGKQFKSLRRHLATLGMTPEQYRAKWDLPSTYPMVAPNYAAQRSALARSIGLGQLREKPVVATAASASEVVPSEPASVVGNEVVAPEPPTVAQSKGIAAPPEVAVKRKPGRPPKAKSGDADQ